MTIADTPTPELLSRLRLIEMQLNATRDNRRQEQHLTVQARAIKLTLKERGHDSE